jgi:hypothetical protein
MEGSYESNQENDMANEVIIELIARTEAAQKQMDELKDQIKDLTESQKKAQKSTNSLVKGFKGIGLAMKAMGIGIILKLFDALGNAMGRNQKAADLLTTATTTINILFDDLIKLLEPLMESLMGVFTNPLESIKSFGETIKDYVINGFQQIVSAAGHIGTALLKLVKFDFKGAAESAKEAGRDMVDAFVGVEEGGIEVIKEGLEVVNKYTQELPKRIKKASKQATELIKLNKEAELAEVERQRLQLEFQKREERLRQIRDDEFRSIEDRKKANADLLVLLSEQEEAERKAVELRIAAAKAQFEMTGMHEDEVALRQAELELIDLTERIEGQRSEALTNRVALEKESLEIERSRKLTLEEIANIEAQAAVEMETNKLKQLQSQQKLETDIHMRRLDRIGQERLAMAAAGQQGTQAYQDLINEQNKIDAEYEQNSLKRTEQMEKLKKDARVSLAQDGLKVIGDIFGQESAAGKAAAVASATIDTYKAFNNALANTPLPPPGPQIAAGLTLAQGFAQVRNILSTPIPNNFGGGGAGGAGGGGAATPTLPNVSILGGNEAMTQATRSISELGKKPTRAFVVSGDVTNNQALDRRIERNASFG